MPLNVEEIFLKTGDTEDAVVLLLLQLITKKQPMTTVLAFRRNEQIGILFFINPDLLENYFVPFT